MADPVAINAASGNGSAPSAPSSTISPPGNQPVSRPSTQEPGGQPATTAALTPDPLRVWADSPVTLTPPVGAAVQFTPDQFRQWATSGTGPLETSEALGKPGAWFIPGSWNNIGRVIGQQGIRAGLDAAAGLLGLGSTATGMAREFITPQSMFEGRSVQDVPSRTRPSPGPVCPAEHGN